MIVSVARSVNLNCDPSAISYVKHALVQIQNQTVNNLNLWKPNVEIRSEGEYFMTSIKGWYFRRIMDEHSDFYFYNKDWFHLLIHKYYYKYVSIHTYLSHYILSVLFVSLLSEIVHLLPQINIMRTALFCVACALLVFNNTV